MGWFKDAADIVSSWFGVGAQYSAEKYAADMAYKGTSEMNLANKKLAEENRAFQERMSSTAYQRQKADLEAAGYNPALAYTQGPASTPQGGVIPMQNELSEKGSRMAKAVSSAMDRMMFKKQMEVMEEQRRKNHWEAYQAWAVGRKHIMDYEALWQQVNKMFPIQVDILKNQKIQGEWGAWSAESMEKLNKQRAELNSDLLMFDKILGYLRDFAGTGKGVIFGR